MTKAALWELRQEIVLNSLYTSDFNNSFGHTAHSVQNFFDGYMSYIEELMNEDGVSDNDVFNVLSKYDTIDNLWMWWNMFSTNPLENEVQGERK
jgi:cupin superfamily acireductone dioxygenase involved in methionine salvage